jgi:O-antigen ligase
VLIAGWALFGFAGAYRWTLAPLGAAVGVLALVCPPRFPRSRRVLDAAIGAGLAVAALQLVPVPPSVRLTLAPASAALDRALLLDAPENPGSGAFRPLSVDPVSSAWGLATALLVALLYWCARATLERSGGSRLVVRGVAWLGLGLAAEMFVQQMVSPDLIYGFWRPIANIGDPHPIGPFLNRNDLAAWLAMAIPLVIGYALTRIDERQYPESPRANAEPLLDTRMLWLAGSLCLMIAALLASLSRSGLVGASAALVAVGVIGRERLSPPRTAALACGVAVLALAATAYADVGALAARFSSALPDFGGRPTIWRETWPIARDFPLTGIGIGAFERAMTVYQQSPRVLFFKHAHNEYLQLLVEGGILLAVPVLVLLTAGCASIARQLRGDSSPMFWLRAGAAASMIAVGMQSVWDTGLRMPANAALFAIAAAVATRER